MEVSRKEVGAEGRIGSDSLRWRERRGGFKLKKLAKLKMYVKKPNNQSGTEGKGRLDVTTQNILLIVN